MNMMNLHKLYYRIYYILSITLIWCLLLFSSPQTFANTLFDPSFSEIQETIDEILRESINLAINLENKTENNKNSLSTKILIKNYCNTLKEDDKWARFFWGDDQIYKAQDSLFNYLLCNSIQTDNERDQTIKEKKRDFLTKHTLNALNIIDYKAYTYTCDPNNQYIDMNTCRFEEYLPQMLQSIFNDYYTIAQLRILWSTDSNEKVKEQANTFSKEHFAGLELCGKDKKRYPKTCRRLQGFIRNVRNLADKTTIIDVKKLSKSAKAYECSSMYNSSYPSIYCGLLWEQQKKGIAFNNLVYNELFWYRIFVQYYITQSSKHSNTIFVRYNNENKNWKNQQTIYTKYLNADTNLTQALDIANTYLQSVENSFPYHIGFLMYQEDLINIRRPLADMYTPIRTLFDKLRNVQDADS